MPDAPVFKGAFKAVIPARYASTRLPGKPLLEIAGRPMIQHVHARAMESGADEVVIALDDERIRAAVEGFGGRACMTSTEHRNGAERINEVVERFGWGGETIVVNVQGDEPDCPPELIRQVAGLLAAHPEAQVATLAAPIGDAATLFDPNVVKVVCDGAGLAHYFSRAPIPWHRDGFAQSRDALPKGVDWLRHIGIYAYRAGYLARYVGLPPAPTEQAESLEQLRVLWHGGRICVGRACALPGHGVDTPADLERVRAAFAARGE